MKVITKHTMAIEDRIWVHDFNAGEAQKICDRILRVAEKDESEPVILYVDSYGGMVDSLMSILSVVDSIPNPLVTIATGSAMSCGAVLLSHGDFRCVGPHSRIMVHEVSAGAMGNINDIKNDTEELDRINKYLMTLLSKNCGMSLEELKKRFSNEKRDIFLTPHQAVRFGIADKVGIPTIDRFTGFHVRFLHHDKETGKKGKK